MNLRQLCDASVRLGMALDVRGEPGLRDQMRRRREEYEALPEWAKPYYDQERFRNPFGDVRIAWGADDVELSTIMVGVDIHVEELLLADRLRAKGRRVDAVIAHHAHGVGRSPLLSHDTMPVNVETLVEAGVSRSAAEASILPYVEDKLTGMEDFHRLGPETAELLDLPLACIHTPADYYMTVGVRQALEEAEPATLAETIPALLTIPEVHSSAAKYGVFPRVFAADPSRRVGRTFLKFGGGYILPPSAYPLLGAAGVDTVFQIHCEQAHADAAASAGVAIVRIPHAACDNIGINLLFDDIEKDHGRLDIIPCGGFERISRT